MLPLVLPSEAVTLPHVRPALSSRILKSSSLEAVAVSLGVGLGRRRFAEQSAQVDEVLLRRGAFLQARRACHFAMNSLGVNVGFSVLREPLPCQSLTSLPRGQYVLCPLSTRTTGPRGS